MSRLALFVLYPAALAAWATVVVLALLAFGATALVPGYPVPPNTLYADVWGWLGELFPIYADGIGETIKLLVVWTITALIISTWTALIRGAHARIRMKRDIENTVYDIMKPYVSGLGDVASIPAIAEKLNAAVATMRTKNSEAAVVLDRIAGEIFGEAKLTDVPDLIAHARVLAKKGDELRERLKIDESETDALEAAVLRAENSIGSIHRLSEGVRTGDATLTELEERFASAKSSLSTETVAVFMERVKSFSASVDEFEQLVSNPLGTRYDLDDVLGEIERQIGDIENVDVDDLVGRLEDVERQFKSEQERLGDVSTTLTRVRTLVTDVEKLSKLLERMTDNPLGQNKPDLDDTLSQLESDIGDIENVDVGDRMERLTNIDTRLSELKATLARHITPLHVVA